MTEAYKFLIDSFKSVLDQLDSIKFDFFGFKVSYWGIIFAGIIISMIAAVWWKGARG